MPNRVIGSTDASGAVSVIPNGVKSVCIVATKGTAPSQGEKVLFDIYSTGDAEAKFGADATAPKLVDILIRNGVTNIKGIMTNSALATPALQYEAALDELMRYNNIDIIITDKLDATVDAKVKTHLDTAESENMLRYAVVGLAAGSDNAALVAKALTMNSKRIFIPGPTVLDETGVALSGMYAATALAAKVSVETMDPALPMNGVELTGFGGVERVLLQSEKDALVAGGVVPLYNSPSGAPTIHRLVTTYTKDTDNNDDTTWQEGTTIFIADDVLNSVRNRITTNYKRTKNVARILASMKTDVLDVLKTKNDLEIIENFDPKSVSVIKDPNDAYGALIDYTFDVVTPLYNVTIRQHMKL